MNLAETSHATRPEKAGLSLRLVLPIAALAFTLAVPGATLGDIDELDDDVTAERAKEVFRHNLELF